MESRTIRAHTRPASMISDDEMYPSDRIQATSMTAQSPSRRKEPMRSSHPKLPLTPNAMPATLMSQPMSNPLLPSAPASPPTPAPSPTPHQRATIWRAPVEVFDDTDTTLTELNIAFGRMSVKAKEYWLATIVDSFDNHLLNFVHQLVSPRLKKDPFQSLPNELCFKVTMPYIFSSRLR